MQPLAFPPYDLPTRQDGGKTYVLDPVRRAWVRLTPEEWVRQHLLRYLAEAGYPAGLTAVEKGFPYQGRTWRADAVVYDRHRRPLLLAECKAPSVPVTQAAFDLSAYAGSTVEVSVSYVTDPAFVAAANHIWAAGGQNIDGVAHNYGGTFTAGGGMRSNPAVRELLQQIIQPPVITPTARLPA